MVNLPVNICGFIYCHLMKNIKWDAYGIKWLGKKHKKGLNQLFSIEILQAPGLSLHVQCLNLILFRKSTWNYSCKHWLLYIYLYIALGKNSLCELMGHLQVSSFLKLLHSCSAASILLCLLSPCLILNNYSLQLIFPFVSCISYGD